MGFSISSLFKPKAVTPEVSVAADPYQKTREKVISALDSSLGQDTYKPYTGERVAGMGEAENRAQSILNEYLGYTPDRAQPNATRQKAMDEINSIIGSGGDPSLHPTYQAVKAEAARNADTMSKQINDQFAGNRAFWTGSRVKAQANAATDTTNRLNTLLAELGDAQNQRQMSAKQNMIPLLLNEADRSDAQGRADEQLPLQKLAAANQYGSLPRAIQQALFDAQYDEYNKSSRQYPMELLQLAAGTQQAPLYAQQQFMPSTFQNVADLASDFVPLFKKTPK
jgi:hypothetical protein